MMDIFTFYALNQKAAILAGQFIMKGCPRATNIAPIITQKYPTLMNENRTSPIA